MRHGRARPIAAVAQAAQRRVGHDRIGDSGAHGRRTRRRVGVGQRQHGDCAAQRDLAVDLDGFGNASRTPQPGRADHRNGHQRHSQHQPARPAPGPRRGESESRRRGAGRAGCVGCGTDSRCGCLARWRDCQRRRHRRADVARRTGSHGVAACGVNSFSRSPSALRSSPTHCTSESSVTTVPPTAPPISSCLASKRPGCASR